ncbi:MAG: cell cycle two-component system response regulator CpdR [Alphaproteobacteria bacterium]
MALILLAEDDKSLCVFLKKALQKAGHDVTAVECGDDALRLLERTEFDLLLTDIVMPGIDGIELASMAAERHPDMKIMFITGFAVVALYARNEAPKDSKVLSKPFHLRDLVREVNRLVAAPA